MKTKCTEPCGLNHCDTNGCMNRDRALVEPTEELTPKGVLAEIGISLQWHDRVMYLALGDKLVEAPTRNEDLPTKLYNLVKSEFQIDCAKLLSC